MSSDSKVTATIDFSSDGKHWGHLSIPHSRNASAWGAVHLPVISIRGGQGQVMVITGGNHGDEYEGPIALMKLARELEAGTINGQVIIIPALNFPAVMAGARVSPIDGVNMNRAFPGDRNGSVSSMIAHFVTEKILPRADAVLDIHSGGKTLMFSPQACYHKLDDADLTLRAMQAAMAFGAPITLELVELDAGGMLDSTVEDMGKVFVTTELGGGGTTTPETIAMAERGIRNLLAHFGVTSGKPVPCQDQRMMHMPDTDCVIICDDAGIYEALVNLNATITAGDAIGQIHFPEKPERAPVVYRAARDGVLIARSHKALVEPGDFLALIAADR
ncbi:MAG: succinylglutamate desuccinylase/aspartoacylase family protein [Rhodospirillaceae bacterium]|nr:succinylglutamate desuccinylase/aspartoacylase family protein [Rhodospirillaceae bacterium]